MDYSELLEELAGSLSNAAKDLNGKAGSLYELGIMRSKMHSERKEAARAKEKIGEIIYARYLKGEEFPVNITELCEEVTLHMGEILQYKSKMAGLKGEVICPSCGRSVPASSDFCPKCGKPIPKAEDEKEAVAEEKADTSEASDTEQSSEEV